MRSHVLKIHQLPAHACNQSLRANVLYVALIANEIRNII